VIMVVILGCVALAVYAPLVPARETENAAIHRVPRAGVQRLLGRVRRHEPHAAGKHELYCAIHGPSVLCVQCEDTWTCRS
jgi:hypothetical protein